MRDKRARTAARRGRAAQRAFNDPSFGQDDEPVTVASANDLQLPGTGPPYGGQHLRPLIARIADHTLDERELTTHLAQQRFGAIAVLHPAE